MNPVIPNYHLGHADAVYLLAILNGETDLPDRSPEDLYMLLCETLRLTKRLNDNCREWLELMGIIHGDMHPYSVEKLNIPTLEGALAAAITIPRVEACNRMCATCAFRVGSPANQTENVTEDIVECLREGRTFYCHDFEGPKPERACQGFVKAMAARTKNPEPLPE